MTSEVTHAIGQAAPRADGLGKATGASTFTADVLLPGALWAKALRSTRRHARIVRIDVSRAKAMPGVHAVLTGHDVPATLFGRRIKDLPVLAQGVVRHLGEQVAAVAADDIETAERALQLIDVEYEELPYVLDPFEAMEPRAVLVHPLVHTYGGLPTPLDGPTNEFVRNEWNKGDVVSGFAEADVIVENTFTTAPMHQGYMETNSWIVWVDEEGRAQVWASNKTPYPTKNQAAPAMGISPDEIRVNPVTIGGDFGGKGQARNVPLCYHLAKAAGRPVRMVMAYAEELAAGNPRHPSVIRMRTGAKRDGTLVAHEAELVFNSGAYAGFIPQGSLPGAALAGGPYRIPHTHIVSKQVYTNNGPRGYMRGPGRQQSTFAVECQVDCVARELGMDPGELRRRNLVGEGEETAIGERFTDVHGIDTLEAAIDASGYHDAKPANVGRGMAVSHQDSGGGSSHAAVALNPDGTIHLFTPIFEQGTGTYTMLAQVVAECFDLPAERVTVRVWDTDAVEFDTGISAQRGTRIGSQTAHAAAGEAQREMAKLAAELLGWPEDRLRVSGDDLVREDTGERTAWAAIVERVGAPVLGRGSFSDDSFTGITAFTTQVAEVEVDRVSGKVTLRKITTAHDTGVIINPIGHQGQINGAAIQGAGYGLMEEILIVDGRVTTLSLADYKMPTFADTPELRTVLLEPAEGIGPLGVKGIAENASTPAAAAIANAVADACGVRVFELPITAERVYRALRGRVE